MGKIPGGIVNTPSFGSHDVPDIKLNNPNLFIKGNPSAKINIVMSAKAEIEESANRKKMYPDKLSLNFFIYSPPKGRVENSRKY